jgi:hypothetical protein
VIDDQRHGQLRQHRREFDQLIRVQEHLHMPAQPLGLARERREHVRGGGAPRLRRHEVDAQAAHAPGGEPVELGIGHVMRGHGHAARALAELRERVEQAGVVRAVRRRVDHHRARRAEPLLQPAVVAHLRARRLALPVPRRREARIEDVHVAVAGIARQRLRGPVRSDGMGHRRIR